MASAFDNIVIRDWMAEALGKQGLVRFENPTILIGEGPFAQRDLKEFLAKHGLGEPQVTFIEDQDSPCVVFFNRVPAFIIGRSGALAFLRESWSRIPHLAGR